MKLVFKCQKELVMLDIDRKNKRLKVASSKTGYRPKITSWSMLFDKGLERQQEKKTDKLNDKDFKIAIIINMAKLGYKLVREK